MKKKDVYDNVPDYWKVTDLENLFDINGKSDDRFWFNLNESLYLRVPDSALATYRCQYATMHWPLISYVIYGTTRLAWLLMKLNGVGPEQAFMPKRAADPVKYIGKEQLPQIIKAINGYN